MERIQSFLGCIGQSSQINELLKPGQVLTRREPRVAMVGRSNVGKSSLLNALLGKTVARVSQEPGKTREIYFYPFSEFSMILVDLPGYGFAKAAKSERRRWGDLIEQYLRQDPGLDRVLVLMDARHGPSDLDMEALEFILSLEVKVEVVMTKFDQVKTQSDRARRKREVAEKLSSYQNLGIPVHWISVKTADGVKPLKGSLRCQEP